MKRHARPRIAVVGIDGFSPSTLQHYLGDGVMPALASLVARGARVPLISTLPATTPVAWTAMSTGCYPSKNGIEGFLLHRPGRRLDDRISGVYAEQMTAEPLWQTACLNGLSSYVVKFPVSYPSAATLRVDGAAGWGGLTCLHETAASGTRSWPDSEDATISEAAPWLGQAPEQFAPVWFGRLSLPNTWGHAPVCFDLAVSEGKDGPTLSIAHGADWSNLVMTLLRGEWSNPIEIEAVNRRGVLRRCALRFKTLAAETSPVSFQLFNTPLHELDGHSHPDALWQKHLRAAGPIEEQTDPSLLFSGAIDIATHVDRCQLNIDWLSRISRSILRDEPWDLYMVHTHIVDWAHHLLQGAIDPRHPRFEPNRADEAEGLLRHIYALTDQLVATVIDAVGESANVIVMGDHGQDLHHTTVRFNCWLAEAGYLCFRDDDPAEVDWGRTRACVLGNGVYLNVAGREPTGIVHRDQAGALIDELCAGLLDISDPRNGERVVHIAAPRDHFAALGAHGPGMGDIVFCLSSGYQARNNPGPMFEITIPWTEFTSGHDHFWPLDPRLQTLMFAAGPAFVAGRHASRLHSIVDVAPTISSALGMASPPDIDGSPINSILADPPYVSAKRSPLEV
ncbi:MULTISPECIES: alkaline phosphatase family protein [Bradyrhizobium]|uniref:alkaline phosphatase family protein n=1 Tax=Bradyrhizobium pachyrhizi TaxID=280333 RepID=UPI0003F5903B